MSGGSDVEGPRGESAPECGDVSADLAKVAGKIEGMARTLHSTETQGSKEELRRALTSWIML